MINFKANFIHSTNILERNKRQDYVDYKASFVEINPKNYDDVLAVNLANINWDNGETLATYITHRINLIHKNKPQEKERKFYALTQQQDKFEKLNADKLLGLVSVLKMDENTEEIDYIQLNPEYLGRVRNFIKMGNAMMDSIKTIFPKKFLEVDSNGSAFKFYVRNGFSPINDLLRMRFTPKI